jgi:hypothetical protein
LVMLTEHSSCSQTISNPGKFVASVIAVPSAERWTESTCCNITTTIFKNLKININT